MAQTKTNQIFSQFINTIRNNDIIFNGKYLSDLLIHIKIDKNNPYYFAFKIISIYRNTKISDLKIFVQNLLRESFTNEELDYISYFEKNIKLQQIKEEINSIYFSKYCVLFLFEIENEGHVLTGIKYPFNNNLNYLYFQDYTYKQEKNQFTSNIDKSIRFISDIDTTIGFYGDKSIDVPDFPEYKCVNTNSLGQLFIISYLYRALKLIENINEVKNVKLYRGEGIYNKIYNNNFLFKERLKILFNTFKEVDFEKNIFRSIFTDDYIMDITYNGNLTDNKDKHYWLRLSFVESANSRKDVIIIPIINTQTLLNVSRNALKSTDSPEAEDIFRKRQQVDIDFILENLKKIFSKYSNESIIDDMNFRLTSMNRGYFQIVNTFKNGCFHSYPIFILNIKYTKNDTLFNFDIMNTHNSKERNSYHKFLLKTSKETYNRNMNIIKDVITFFNSKRFKNHIQKTANIYKVDQKLSTLAIDINRKIKERETPFDLLLTYGIYSFSHLFENKEETIPF